MITEIEMKFRHLRGIALRGLSAVNIIVGPNNAGKTSIFRGVQSLVSARVVEGSNYIYIGTRVVVPDDMKSKIERSSEFSSVFYRSREDDLERVGPIQWWRRDAGHRGVNYISHGNEVGASALKFIDGVCQLAPLSNVLAGKSAAGQVGTAMRASLFEDVTKPLLERQDAWRKQSYFLWHRRKSRYEESLGAHYARLDEEAEHLAGRLDHLLSETRGGLIRQRINRFMNAVVPNIGEIGIRRREHPGDQKGTIISVVFSDLQGERSLEELGGGVEQTLALALVLIGENDEGAVFIEEPESHLHESAQRRLIEQIEKHRGARQVFIATHSPVFVNEFPGANVYRVTRDTDGGAKVHPCVDRASQREVLNELGVLPSSLTQTNCVVWVEGPTETRLVRRWLELVAPELKVHQYYEFAQTGGSNLASLAADVSANDPGGLHDIMRVCRHNFIICDRDAGIGSSAVKAPVQAIERLIGKHHWITRGYEIEWYVPRAIIASVWNEKVGEHMAACLNQDEPFYARLATSGEKTKSAGEHKVKWAERFASAQFGPEVWFDGESGGELRAQVERLAAYIREANQMAVSKASSCSACGQATSPR